MTLSDYIASFLFGEYGIKMEFIEIECERVEWINVAQNTVQRRDSASKVRKLLVV
jgi:hypothetical protein